MRQERITRQPAKRRPARAEQPQSQPLRRGGPGPDTDVADADELVARIEAVLAAAA